MAERVSSLLRRSVEHLADEVPDSYRLLVAELGPLVVELDVDGEVFSLRGGDRLAGLGRCGAHGRCPDRHLASRHPRRARCQGRAWRGRGGGHGVACTARSTTSCVRTTHCSPTCTPRSGRPSQPGLLSELRTGAMSDAHLDAGIPRTASHGRGPRGRHRRPHRRSRTRGARFRRHGVRATTG